jgi:hypothetical protein
MPTGTTAMLPTEKTRPSAPGPTAMTAAPMRSPGHHVGPGVRRPLSLLAGQRTPWPQRGRLSGAGEPVRRRAPAGRAALLPDAAGHPPPITGETASACGCSPTTSSSLTPSMCRPAWSPPAPPTTTGTPAAGNHSRPRRASSATRNRSSRGRYSTRVRAVSTSSSL